jgi:hypothetical protein
MTMRAPSDPACAKGIEAARMARLVCIAIVVAIGLVNLIWAFSDWTFNDLHAYQSAALRLRDGADLYGGNVTPWTAYRYAPWFAYAFVPLASLPWKVLVVVWTGFTVGCSMLAIVPLLRDRRPQALLLAGIFGPLLVAVSVSGNMQAPIIALLVWALPTRWGPIAIGLAASLKVTPLLLCIGYLSNRQWRQALAAAAIATLLWAPVLFFQISPITFDSGGAAISTWAWLVLGGGATLGALWLAYRGSRWAWLGAAVAAYLSTPRLYLYDTTFLLAAPAMAEPDRRFKPGVLSESRSSIPNNA